MHLKEFITRLSGLPPDYQPRVLNGRIIRLKRPDGTTCCPITAICEVTTGKIFPERQVFRAAKQLGLPEYAVDALVSGMDAGYNSMRSRIIFQRLCVALKVKPE